MSYQFPHFDDIPHPKLVTFTYPDDIVGPEYCDLTTDCRGCIFDADETICAADSSDHHADRKALLAYVKSNHPEYLI